MTEEGEFIEPLGACASTINIGGEGRDGGVVVADDHSIDEKGNNSRSTGGTLGHCGYGRGGRGRGRGHSFSGGRGRGGRGRGRGNYFIHQSLGRFGDTAMQQQDGIPSMQYQSMMPPPPPVGMKQTKPYNIRFGGRNSEITGIDFDGVLSHNSSGQGISRDSSRVQFGGFISQRPTLHHHCQDIGDDRDRDHEHRHHHHQPPPPPPTLPLPQVFKNRIIRGDEKQHPVVGCSRGNPVPDLPMWFDQHGTNRGTGGRGKYLRDITVDSKRGSSRVTVTIVDDSSSDAKKQKKSNSVQKSPLMGLFDSSASMELMKEVETRRVRMEKEQNQQQQQQQQPITREESPAPKRSKGHDGKKIERHPEEDRTTRSEPIRKERLIERKEEQEQEEEVIIRLPSAREQEDQSDDWIIDTLFGDTTDDNNNTRDDKKRKRRQSCEIIRVKRSIATEKTQTSSRATTVPVFGNSKGKVICLSKKSETTNPATTSGGKRDHEERKRTHQQQHRERRRATSEEKSERFRKIRKYDNLLLASTSTTKNNSNAAAERRQMIIENAIATADREVFRAIGYLCSTLEGVVQEWANKPVTEPSFVSKHVSTALDSMHQGCGEECSDGKTLLTRHKEAFNLRLSSCVLLGKTSFIAARISVGIPDVVDPWNHSLTTSGWLGKFVDWMEMQGAIVTLRFESINMTKPEEVQSLSEKREKVKDEMEQRRSSSSFAKGREHRSFSGSLIPNPMMSEALAACCGLISVPRGEQGRPSRSTGGITTDEKYIVVEAFLPLPM